MRTAIIIAAGFVILAIFVYVGRRSGRARGAAALFIPVWFVVAAVNLWLGVQAGYTFVQELPIFLLIFGVPAIAAAIVRGKRPSDTGISRPR
jgi:hypothetical protein